MLRLHTPLFDLADDASNGGGATPPAAPVSVENPAAPTGNSAPVGSPAPSAAPKPSVIATATALLRGANANAATVAALRADVTARDTTIADLTAQLAARDTTIASQLVELQTYRTQSADLQTAVAALEARNVNVQTEVIHQLAAAGLPETQLPRGTNTVNQPGETVTELREKLSDPSLTSLERGQIAQKIRTLNSKN